MMGSLENIRKSFRDAGKFKIAGNIKEFERSINSEKIKESISNVETLKKTMEQELGKSFVEKFNDALKGNYGKTFTDKVLNFSDALKKTISVAGIVYSVKKGIDALSSVSKANIDMIETQNLFQVQIKNVTDEYGNLKSASSNYYDRAIAFQDDLNKKIYTNKSEMMKYQAMYYGMFNAQNIDKNASYFMSENLTKAGIDISSLFNLDMTDSMNKLKSGLAGQVESLRQIGIDVSESALSTVLNEVGIDRSVQELSYAEKEIARYIAIVQQAGKAQGDFARTFDSPANQLKMLKNQFIELAQVAGSFVVNAFGGIIKYAIATVVAIKNVLKSLAELFGFKLNTDDSLGNVNNEIGDIGDGIDSATKKAKEFKKQLMGFDEINNITPPTESSGGSGGGSSGGVDSKLLDALEKNPWNMHLEEINDEINKIAKNIEDKIKPIIDWIREHLDLVKTIAEQIGIAIIAWKLSSTLTKFLQNLGILNRTQAFQIAFGLTLAITGIWGMYKGIKKMLEGDLTIENVLATLVSGAGGIFGIATMLKGMGLNLKSSVLISVGVTLAIAGFEVLKNGLENNDFLKTLLGGGMVLGGTIPTIVGLVDPFKKAWGKLKPIFSNITKGASNIANTIRNKFKGINPEIKEQTNLFSNYDNQIKKNSASMQSFGEKCAKVMIGLAGLVTSTLMVNDAFKSMNEGTKTATEGVAEIGVSLATSMASGATIGTAILPGWGTAIGATIAAIWTGITSIYDALTYKSKAEEEIAKQNDKALQKEKELAEERRRIWEKTAEMNKSYYEQLNAIYEKQDADLASIEIAKKQAQSLETLIDSNGRVKKGYEERADYILNELNEALGLELKRNGNVITQNGKTIKSYKDLISKVNETAEAKRKEVELNALNELWSESLKQQIKWQKEVNRLQQEGNVNTEELENAKRELKSATQDCTYYEQEYFSKVSENSKKLSKDMIEDRKYTDEHLQKMAKDNVKEWEKVYQEVDNVTKGSMLAQSTTLNTWSPKIKQKWEKLAKDSVTDFSKNIGSIDVTLQQELLESVTQTQKLSPELINAWENLAINSAKDFEKGLSKIPSDTASTILSSVSKTKENAEKYIGAWVELANRSETDYNTALSKIPEDVRIQIQNSVSTIQSQQKVVSKAVEFITTPFNSFKNIDLGGSGKKVIGSLINGISSKNPELKNQLTKFSDDIKKTFKNVDLFSTGKSIIEGLSKGINSVWKSFTNTIKKVGDLVPSTIRSILKINSPSKVMIPIGAGIPEGLAVGINKETSDVVKEAENMALQATRAIDDSTNINVLDKLSKGISINPKDYELDTNQFVNYSAIKGQILAQSQISMNDNIAEKIAEAVTQSMRNTEVNVNIEARTDEGIIFKKVQNSAREYTMQTGEPAFSY